MFTRITNNYCGTTAIVIGAGGIGGAIIQLLAGNVAQLVIADQDENLLAKVAQMVSEAGQTNVVTRKLNVRDGAAVADFFAYIKANLPVPDYCFYAVGILNLEPFAETSASQWERAVSINLNGAFYCTQAAAELMKPQQRGSILLLGSIAGTKARSGSRVNPVYNATKAGLAAFVNSAAMQLRSFGIRLNCISPGPTATQMMDQQPPQVHAAVSEVTLNNRMNNATEVAELALFIAAHGRFTGEDIGMGGGAGLGG